MRILKAILAILLAYLIVPIAFATICYKKNEWPWEGLFE